MYEVQLNQLIIIYTNNKIIVIKINRLSLHRIYYLYIVIEFKIIPLISEINSRITYT